MTRIHELQGERREAVYDSTEAYRYRLTIEWDREIVPEVAFIGLNPSTATELVDDPTVRKLKRWAQRMEYGRMHMLNAYAFRSTDPKKMLAADDPVGRFNDEWIDEVCNRYADGRLTVVACWGGNCDPDRELAILQALWGQRVYCFAKTKSGSPGHPLYLKEPMSLDLFCDREG